MSHLNTRQLRQTSCPRSTLFALADKITDHCTKWAIVTPGQTACGTKHHFFNIHCRQTVLFVRRYERSRCPLYRPEFSRVGDIRPRFVWPKALRFDGGSFSVWVYARVTNRVGFCGISAFLGLQSSSGVSDGLRATRVCFCGFQILENFDEFLILLDYFLIKLDYTFRMVFGSQFKFGISL